MDFVITEPVTPPQDSALPNIEKRWPWISSPPSPPLRHSAGLLHSETRQLKSKVPDGDPFIDPFLLQVQGLALPVFN